jgi:hypothetical protein
MKIFPPSAVFVCDNGPWDQPRDRTIEVCRQLSLEVDPTGADQSVPLSPLRCVFLCTSACVVWAFLRINYVFIPEGNKTHAMYWTTEYWIPELVRHQVSWGPPVCAATVLLIVALLSSRGQSSRKALILRTVSLLTMTCPCRLICMFRC